MFIVNSAELRWFVKDNIDTDLLEWLKNLSGSFELQTQRTDTYLLDKRNISPGIKFREGRFEIKQLKKKLNPRKLSDNVFGNPEIWKKWSLSAERINDSLLDKTEWLDVVKERYLQRFSFTPTGKDPIPAEKGTYPSPGCNIELTRISCNNWKGFTLGIEAYGNSKNIETALFNTTKKILPSCQFDFFQLNNSMGYPEWLSKLVFL